MAEAIEGVDHMTVKSRLEVFKLVRTAAQGLIAEIDPPLTPLENPKGASGWVAELFSEEPHPAVVRAVDALARERQMTAVDAFIHLEEAWSGYESQFVGVGA